jgi:uncharacterized protein (TIGR03000 family)
LFDRSKEVMMAWQFMSMGCVLSLCLSGALPAPCRAQTILNQTIPIRPTISDAVPERIPRTLPPYMTTINYPLVYGSYTMFPHAIPPSFTSGGSMSSNSVDPSMRPWAAARSASALAPAVPARITVVAPKNADVFFQDVQVPMSGTIQRFSSPALNPLQTYTYDVRATWRENGAWVTESNRVLVRAGDEITVRFTRAPFKLSPVPALPRPSSLLRP